MDVVGIGIDLVSVERIKKLWVRYKKRFENKVFTSEEVSYAFKKATPFQSLAGFFAAKEAYYKALGGYPGFSFKEIEVIKKHGRPFLRCKGRALEELNSKGIKEVFVSISHERDFAVAVVMLKK
jgi:holo-[acyl-carrier protein] synthase